MHIRSYDGPVGVVLLLWVGCLGAGLLGLHFLDVAGTGIDDAYIFFVYADNLAAGNGLVYNAGSEVVEGYSSFGWLLILAALFGVGLGPSGALVLTALLAAIGLYAVWTVLCRLDEGLTENAAGVALHRVLAVAWMLAAPGWFLWNVASLMDLALWGCLLSIATGLFVREVYKDAAPDSRSLAVVFALMLLARPEALAWVPFFVLALYLLAREKGVPWQRVVLFPAAVSLATALLLTIFRLVYFGYPLPNTFYAKVSPDFSYNLYEGGVYLIDYLTGAGFAAIGALLAIVVVCFRLPGLIRLLLGRGRFQDPLLFTHVFVAAAIVAALLIAMLEGGDHFGGARFLQPVYPLIVVLLVSQWLLWRRRSQRLTFIQAGVWLVLASVLFGAPVRGAWFNIDRTGIRPEFEVANEGLATAAALSAVLQAPAPEDVPEVAVTGAGAFKYAWRGRVFDLMGLNDVRMAHAPGDRKGYRGHAAFNSAVFFARAPEIVIPHLEGWRDVVAECRELQEPGSFYWEVLDGLQADPLFRQRYEFVTQTVPEGRLCMYVRRDYLARLMAAGLIQPE